MSRFLWFTVYNVHYCQILTVSSDRH